jgi:alpha-L-fucosidase
MRAKTNSPSPAQRQFFDAARLRLLHNGESIYGTRSVPFPRGPWGAATYNGDTIYVHVLDPNLDTVTLTPLGKKITGSSLLTGGTATVKQTEQSIEIPVPKADRQEIDTIVVLKLDGAAVQGKKG